MAWTVGREYIFGFVDIAFLGILREPYMLCCVLSFIVAGNHTFTFCVL